MMKTNGRFSVEWWLLPVCYVIIVVVIWTSGTTFKVELTNLFFIYTLMILVLAWVRNGFPTSTMKRGGG